MARQSISLDPSIIPYLTKNSIALEELDPDAHAMAGGVVQYLKGLFFHALMAQTRSIGTVVPYLQRLQIASMVSYSIQMLQSGPDDTIRQWSQSLSATPLGPLDRVSTENILKMCRRTGIVESHASLIYHVLAAWGDRPVDQDNLTAIGPRTCGGDVIQTWPGVGIRVKTQPDTDACPAFWRMWAAVAIRENLETLQTDHTGLLARWALPIDPCYVVRHYTNLPVTNIAGIFEGQSACDVDTRINPMTFSSDSSALCYLKGIMHIGPGAAPLIDADVREATLARLESDYVGGRRDLRLVQLMRDAKPELGRISYIYGTKVPAYESASDKFAARHLQDLFQIDETDDAARGPDKFDDGFDPKVGVDLLDDGTKSKPLPPPTSMSPGNTKSGRNDMATNKPNQLDNTMDLISFKRDGEPPNALQYRQAVLALQAALDRQNPRSVSAESRSVLRTWCNRWLFLTPVAETSKLLNTLGFGALLAPLKEKISNGSV